MNRQTLVQVAAVAAALTVVSIGSATAASQITSKHLATGAANHRVIKDGGVKATDLSPGIRAKVNRPNHTVYVTGFGGVVNPFPGDEAGLAMTGEGAEFGPFATGGGCNAGTDFARLVFHGLDGKPLGAVNQLDYSGMTQSADNTSGVGSLSMRIVTDGVGTGDYPNNKFVFSPNTQPGADQNADTRGEVKTYLTTLGFWRLNDDAGEGPDSPWKTIIAGHEGEHITKVDVLLGCEAGTNLRGVVRELQANGTDYVLGSIG
jgi:hypothetical protein